jgi:hypothetical protein
MIGAIIGGIICIIAGIYLAQIRSVGGTSVMEAIGNGIGWYCIGKGLFLISNAVQLSPLKYLKPKKETKKLSVDEAFRSMESPKSIEVK